MDEDPKDHDFDQRRDGPLQQPQRPRRSLDIPPFRGTGAALRKISPFLQAPDEEKSLNTAGDVSDNAHRRRSVQVPGEDTRVSAVPAAGRKSTQITRASAVRRPSRDFDTRRDGPFGRPSLTMTRRQSSTLPIADDSENALGPEKTMVGSAAEGDVLMADPAAAPGVPNSIETLQSTEAAFEPEPPPLNYSLKERRWYIFMFWGLIVVDCIGMPIALYFSLHYHTNLTPNVVFSIVTAALGGVSIFEYFIRFWRLFKAGSNCRVIGARRMYLDFFHWNFSLGWVIIMIELIVGTVPENPPIRLLSMPCASMLYAFGTEMLVVDILRFFEVPAPFRISSIPKGSQLRPGIYSVIEDVCAVDGSGGTEYREALNRRYEASHVFRAMLRRLGLFWSIGAQSIAIVLTILIFTIDGEAAYVVGWSGPFIWAGIWALATVIYVKYMLRIERKAWTEEATAKQAGA